MKIEWNVTEYSLLYLEITPLTCCEDYFLSYFDLTTISTHCASSVTQVPCKAQAVVDLKDLPANRVTIVISINSGIFIYCNILPNNTDF